MIGPLLAAAVAIASPAPTAPVIAKSFAATVDGTSLVWKSPEQSSYRSSAQPYAQRQGVDFFGSAAGGIKGSVVRDTYAACPDRFSELWSRLQSPVEIVLARARGKTLKLESARIAGRAAFRGSLALPPNECAGYPRGTQTVWLARDTLLPLQITTRRSDTQTTSLEYRAVNTPIPPALFAPPAVGKRPIRLTRASSARRRPAPTPRSRTTRSCPETCRAGSGSPSPAGRRALRAPAPRRRTRATRSSSRRCTGAAGSTST